MRTKRPDLIAAPIAACNRQFREGVRTKDLFRSSAIALPFTNEDRMDDENVKQLRAHLADGSPVERKQAFWDSHAFRQSVRPAKDAWHRVFMLSHHGGIRLNPEKDREWVISGLRDSQKPVFEREMMLWAAMLEVMPPGEDVRKAHDDLKQYVTDAPALTAIIEARVKDPPVDKELQRLEAESRRHRQKSERNDAKAHASGSTFGRRLPSIRTTYSRMRARRTPLEICGKPWSALAATAGPRDGIVASSSGSSDARLPIDCGRSYFECGERISLRCAVNAPEDKKNTFLVRWQLGLAAIYAEAEDPNWAANLTERRLA